jgi:SAM-dependent methyltransferase
VVNETLHDPDGARLYGRNGHAALDYKANGLLADSPFKGKDVLEIGAGDGLLSLWLLQSGARSVVSLEPEADGSTEGAVGRALRLRERVGVDEDRWEIRSDTFQDYQGGGRAFGVILSFQSINHLDEPACMRLLEDPAARETYRRLFHKAHDLLVPDGRLVVADVGRVNMWARLGLASPWAPEIEWHKHQEPETWGEVMRAAGLEPIATRWNHPFYRLRFLGPLLTRRVASRCLGSQFQLTARRPPR